MFGNIGALRRIKDEYKNILENPCINLGLTVGLPDDDNIFKWRASFVAPWDTPYAGGLFFVSLIFPPEYPMRPPKVTFDTPIYHVNVSSESIGELGKTSLNIINRWRPDYKIKDILISIYSLFYMTNIDCPLNYRMANELRNNKNLYEEKIKYFTRKYADFSIEYKTYDNWNFSYIT